MTVRTILVLVLALICGVSAVVGMNQVLKMGSKTSPVGTTSIVIVGSDVARGTVLSESVLEVSEWPKEKVPEGAITEIDEVVDRTTVTRLFKGDPMLESKLADKDAGRGLSAMIPLGLRAFTIRTRNLAVGVGGFMLPGDSVDVLLTTSGSGSRDTTGGGATTTLLQDVQILAVDQELDAPDNNKMDPNRLKNVTLLVTQDQAAKLALGANKGILHLSLRNRKDHREANTRPATMAELRFSQERPRQPGLPSGSPPTSTNVGNTLAAAHPVFSVSPPEKPEGLRQSRPRCGEIRTLRGTCQGSIRVELLK